MASGRSRSPSTPSEGEIIESGSETKATTSQTSLNGTRVDRSTRLNASRSPVPDLRSPRRRRSRSRSRTRSPYQDARGEKRRRYDYRSGDGDARPPFFRRQGARYDDRYYDRASQDRGPSGRHQRSTYYDYDRQNGYGQPLRYTDDYDGRRDKRSRTRSRSPYREARRQKRYSDDERDERNGAARRRGGGGDGRLPPSKQSVSERGDSPVVAQSSKRDAEIRGNQVLQGSTRGESASANGSANVRMKDAPEDKSQFVDEVVSIEERRRRREALKARFNRQETPLLVQALQIGAETDTGVSTPGTSDPSQKSPMTSNVPSGTQSPTDLKIAKDEDLANRRVQPAGVEEGPSAADYDPTRDMREDKLRHDKRHFGEDLPSVAYDETKTAKPDVLIPEPSEAEKDPFDMFAEDDDDMFAEKSPVSKKKTAVVGPGKAVPQPQELDISMMDNWDDPEGYYNVMLGELINGRYHVQQHLGKGMFSSVVRATDSKTGKLVAIKIIRNNDTMRKAGMKEIGILEQLYAADPEDKKHVIRFERYFDHKDHLCMVFENLSMNLREVLKKFGRDVGLNLRAIRTYAQQMLLGLSLLRKCNILHADLKPDNLLVNESRNILKVCDLGSASPASENEITPYLVSRFYRAPEIILGIPYDYAIDVWSIGCTLYELYTGKILFTGRTNNQMLRSIMECRGNLPPKFLRRGTLTPMHFDEMLNFRSVEEDKITGRIVTRMMDFKKPTRDLKTRVMGKDAKGMSDGEAKEIALFVDLLERCLTVNPEKRCTPAEALKHPFIARGSK